MRQFELSSPLSFYIEYITLYFIDMTAEAIRSIFDAVQNMAYPRLCYPLLCKFILIFIYPLQCIFILIFIDIVAAAGARAGWWGVWWATATAG